MAQITIKTSIEQAKVDSLLNQIYRVCRTDPNLSPRPRKEFESAYKKGRLLIALNGSSVVGWLLRIPYNQKFQELAAGYVIESHRSKGVFRKLLQDAFKYVPVSSIVTFNYPFADYLLNKIGFRKSSLWEAIKLSNGKFLINRLNTNRIKAIRIHYQSNKPVYTLYQYE